MRQHDSATTHWSTSNEVDQRHSPETRVQLGLGNNLPTATTSRPFHPHHTHDSQSPSPAETWTGSGALPRADSGRSHFRVTVAHMEGSTRPYRMTARAVATARTADAILETTWELFADKAFAEITLADIAARSGVREQTVLRRFGDKDAVFAAMFAKLGTDVIERRGRVHNNAIDDIVANLVDNYELSGRLTLKMLAEEATTPAVRGVLAAGRTGHRKWCTEVFSDTLAGLPWTERERRLAQLIAICDVHTWENLRISSGLSRRATKLALSQMLAPLVANR